MSLNPTPLRFTLAAAVTCVCACATVSHAALSPIGAAKEKVLFADDFDNGNVNNWSNIGPSTGQATIGTDPGPTTEGVWYPSVEDSGNVTSSVSLSRPVNFFKEQVAIYMRVRVDNLTGLNTSLFRIILNEDGGNRLFTFEIRPDGRTGILYRDATGTLNHVLNPPVNISFPNNQTYRDLRMFIEISDASKGLANLILEQYDLDTNQYVSAHNLAFTVDPHVGGGLFNQIDIFSTNHATSGTNNRAYFDSVMVTVTPEPGSAVLLGLGAAMLLRRGRWHA